MIPSIQSLLGTIVFSVEAPSSQHGLLNQYDATPIQRLLMLLGIGFFVVGILIASGAPASIGGDGGLGVPPSEDNDDDSQEALDTNSDDPLNEDPNTVTETEAGNEQTEPPDGASTNESDIADEDETALEEDDETESSEKSNNSELSEDNGASNEGTEPATPNEDEDNSSDDDILDEDDIPDADDFDP